MSNPDSFETLVPLAYGELRVMARSLMRQVLIGHARAQRDETRQRRQTRNIR